MIRQPPLILDVRDQHGGFTIVHPRTGDTLWRPATVLDGHGAGDTRFHGRLESYDSESFYQLNDNCTKAIYRLENARGYGYRAVVWFDNSTGEREA